MPDDKKPPASLPVAAKCGGCFRELVGVDDIGIVVQPKGGAPVPLCEASCAPKLVAFVASLSSPVSLVPALPGEVTDERKHRAMNPHLYPWGSY